MNACKCFEPGGDGPQRIDMLGRMTCSLFAQLINELDLCDKIIDYSAATTVYALAAALESINMDEIPNELELCIKIEKRCQELTRMAQEYAAVRTAQAESKTETVQ